MVSTVTTKSVFTSKTFWLNVITLIVVALTSVMGTDLIQDHPQVTAVFVMVINFLNIILRYLTDRPVSTFGNDIRQVKQ